MRDLAIVEDPVCRIGAENFGVSVRGANLMVPRELAEILGRYDIRTAAGLVSLLHASPSGVAAELGWGIEGVQGATNGLVKTLQHILPPSFLQPSPPPTLVYGARRPR